MDVVIRACASADDAAWRALRRAMYARNDPAELHAEMVAMCREPERFAQFIGEDADGRALGFVEVSLRRDHVVGTSTSPVAFLESIYVVAAARGNGLARALVAQARALGRARGCSEFASDTLLDNAASQAMHRALGFEETRRVVYFRQSLDD